MKNLYFFMLAILSSCNVFTMEKEQDDLKIDIEKGVVSISHTHSHETQATESQKKDDKDDTGEKEVKKACNATKVVIITAIGTLVTTGTGLAIGLTQK